MLSLLLSASLLLGTAVLPALAFDINANNNVALYWGQNSAGFYSGENEQNLAYYCKDSSPDVIILSFISEYGGDSLRYNMGSCGGDVSSPCPSIGNDIKTCQDNGKIVIISLGGGGASGSLSGDDDGAKLANILWNSFFGGSGSRPFGDAVLDGVDLDVEGGGTAGYSTMISTLQGLWAGANKKYYVTGAPQCVYPDANLQPVMNTVPFDMLFIQFYNNYCGVDAYTTQFNYDQWNNWALSGESGNKNVRLFVGVPASDSAAGTGYVGAGALADISKDLKSKYPSFGGIMMWDASQAWHNDRIDLAVKTAMGGSTGAAPQQPKPARSSTDSVPTSTSTTAASRKSHQPVTPVNVGGTGGDSSTTTTTTPGSTCDGIAEWDSDKTYWHKDQVTHGGHLYTAQWWARGTEPGAPADPGYDMWVDNGACTTKRSPSASSQLNAKHRRGGDHRRSRMVRRGHSS